jgi:3-oxoacyl-[acyl-carrier-protein] synthase II
MSDAIVITGVGTVAADVSLDALADPVRARAVRAERLTQLVLASGAAALADAGLALVDGPPRAAVGVVVGTAFGCGLTNAAFAERLIAGGAAAASPRLFAATVSNAAAGELSIAYRLGGPCITLTAGGAAGLLALAHAADLLRGGHAEALVVSGADATGNELEGALNAAGLCAPGDAAATLVLERAGNGRRAARGVVAGCASGFGHETITAVVSDALDEAGIGPAEVDVAVGHGVAATPALGGRRVAAAVASTSAAGGPLHLVQALAAAPRGAVIVVVDACPSGHVAALVARAGEAS